MTTTYCPPFAVTSGSAPLPARVASWSSRSSENVRRFVRNSRHRLADVLRRRSTPSEHVLTSMRSSDLFRRW